MLYFTVPSADQQNDAIQISGPASKVEGARQALLNRVEELEKEREDRALRSFIVNVSPSLICTCSGLGEINHLSNYNGYRLKYHQNIIRKSLARKVQLSQNFEMTSKWSSLCPSQMIPILS